MNRRNAETLSVSQLNSRADNLLKDGLENVTVQGEIRQISTPGSGHWYLTLCDDTSQLSCAMFRRANSSVNFKAETGLMVEVTGSFGIYLERGQYQMVIDTMKLAGDGDLWQLFEQLKQKLTDEGLFDSDKKQSIPTIPKHIAIITSETGAVVNDVMTVMQRRNLVSKLSLLPVNVQGAQAMPDVVKAFARIGQYNASQPTTAIDCVLLCRGGGSLQDLWAFNTEEVVRAVARCPIPVVSAIGHETDTLLSDYAADLRAGTPSIAAEILSEAQAQIPEQLEQQAGLLKHAMRLILQKQQQSVDLLESSLVNPIQTLRLWRQETDNLQQRLLLAMQQTVERQQTKIDQQTYQLQQAARQTLQQQRQQVDLLESSLVNPLQSLPLWVKETDNLQLRLQSSIQQTIERQQNRVQQLSEMLTALSPQPILKRGYALIQKQSTAITRASALNTDDKIELLFADGKAGAVVTTVDIAD